MSDRGIFDGRKKSEGGSVAGATKRINVERRPREGSWRWRQSGANFFAEWLDYPQTALDIVEQDRPHVIAAVFTVGREQMVPQMFLKIVRALATAHPGKLETFGLLSVLIICPQEFGPVLAVDEAHRSGCFLPLVAMMKAANPGRSDDFGRGGGPALGRSPHRRVPQLSVDSVDVVVVDVLAEKTLQVLLVQDDHVVEKLPTSAALSCDPVQNALRFVAAMRSPPLWFVSRS